jgi:hypothetical protein
VEDTAVREKLKARAVQAMARLEKPLLEPLREQNRIRRRYRIISIANIRPKKTEMIINPILPRGELTLVDGDPDIGKSWFWMALLAGLTGSKVCPLPEPLKDNATPISRALILTAEDDFAKTIRPRLEKLGADLDRIEVVKLTAKDEMFFTAADAKDILELVKNRVPDVIIIDPLTLYATTEQGFDSNRATHVRKMMVPLIRIARELNCVTYASRHFGKSPKRALHKGIGSIDYVAAARSIMVVAEDASDTLGRTRIVAHIKSNLAPKMKEGLLFSLDENQTPPFQWQGTREVNADELTDYNGASNARDERSKLDEAKDFLREILAGGQLVLTQECKEQAYRLGIADTTLLRAKRELGVKAKQSGFAEDKEWFWCLE